MKFVSYRLRIRPLESTKSHMAVTTDKISRQDFGSENLSMYCTTAINGNYCSMAEVTTKNGVYTTTQIPTPISPKASLIVTLSTKVIGQDWNTQPFQT